MSAVAGGTLRVVLGDQLTRGLSALDGLDPATDTVLMAEVMGECSYVPHHKAKIALVLSAMRHHASLLEAEGIMVDYIRLDDRENTGTLTGEVARAARRHRPARIVATEPGEWRVLEAMRGWEGETGLAVEIRPDRRFIASREEFAAWARGRMRRCKGEACSYWKRVVRSSSDSCQTSRSVFDKVLEASTSWIPGAKGL